jgi:hypothetical protein
MNHSGTKTQWLHGGICAEGMRNYSGVKKVLYASLPLASMVQKMLHLVPTKNAA